MNISVIQPFLQSNTGRLKSRVIPLNFKREEIFSPEQYNELRVFYHHIYEYKKGLRNLVLTTERADNIGLIEGKLRRENIPYTIKQVNNKNINVFFGNQHCINIVNTFDNQLNHITPEQDFMLGIMLGYDKILQCKRYFHMRDKFAKKYTDLGPAS